MSIIKAHVIAATCEYSGGTRPRFGEFLTNRLAATPRLIRMACKPRNSTKAGFFFACRQSAIANGPHGRTQYSGRYGKTNRSVENLIQVSPQARVKVTSHRTLPDECIRPAHLGFVNLHCRRSDPRMGHPA